jgi:hypothetical protein
MFKVNQNFALLAPRLITHLKLRKVSPQEHCGPCPDRFRIQNYRGELRHHCRGEARGECNLSIRSKTLRSLGLLPDLGERK